MINPILEREIKSRVRTWRAPFAILAYLFAIGIITYIGMSSILLQGYWGVDPRGITVTFDIIVVVQLMIIMFIVPMFTATSISSERERQTLDLMLCADISPWRIIFGKIGSAMLFVMLLIGLAIPFLSIIFIMGGVTPLDLVKIIIYYAATAFTLSTIGVYTSARFKKNLVSIVMTYIIMAVLYITPLIIFIMMAINGSGGWFESLMKNHTYSVLSLLFGPNPGYGLISLLTNDFFGMTRIITSKGLIESIPSWVISIFFFVIISAVMLWLSYRQLNKRQ